MKINLKVRFKNPVFYVQLLLAFLTPILAYMGLTAADLTSWSKVLEVILEAVNNPYILSLVVVSVYNSLIDPTTQGIGDSARALDYSEPNK